METPLVGRDHFDLTVARSKSFSNPQDKETPIVKYGQVNAELVTHSARANRGDMNNVRAILSEKALAALAK